MKPIELQLITVKLESGQHGIFIGTPLINDPKLMQNNQISEIWFSDIRDLPENLSLSQLMEMVKAQLCHCEETLH